MKSNGKGMLVLRIFKISLIMCLVPFPSFSGEEDLFGDGAEEVEATSESLVKSVSLSVSGTVDVRAIRTGSHLSWDEGGRSITGEGTKQAGDSSFLFSVPRAAMAVDFLYENDSIGFVQLNIDDHRNGNVENFSVGLFEAYLKLKPFKDGKYFKDTIYRVGLLVPPISLEHDSTAWGTTYSVTPSAINTWVGEEVKVFGIEEEYTYELSQWHRLQTTASVFTGNDPIGGILAWRGWALHDYQLKSGDRLLFQGVDPTLAPTGWGTPTKEIDGRPAAFLKLRYLYGDELIVDAFHYGNFADETERDSADYAWKSRFTNLGLKWNFSASWTLLSQLMWGESSMGFRGTNLYVDIDFLSWYLMLNYKSGDHSFTVRYDDFNIEDKDNVNDNNNQDGWAALMAYKFNYSRAQQLSVEYLRAVSERVGREGYPTDDPYDDTFTINYRLIY